MLHYILGPGVQSRVVVVEGLLQRPAAGDVGARHVFRDVAVVVVLFLGALEVEVPHVPRGLAADFLQLTQERDVLLAGHVQVVVVDHLPARLEVRVEMLDQLPVMGGDLLVDRRQHGAEGDLGTAGCAVIGPERDAGFARALRRLTKGRAFNIGSRPGAQEHRVHRPVGLLTQNRVGIPVRPYLAVDPGQRLVQRERAVRIDDHAIGPDDLWQAAIEPGVHQDPGVAEDRLEDLGLEPASAVRQHRHGSRYCRQFIEVVHDAERLHPRRISRMLLDPQRSAGGAKLPLRLAIPQIRNGLMESEKAVIGQRPRVRGRDAKHPVPPACSQATDLSGELADIFLRKEVGQLDQLALEAQPRPVTGGRLQRLDGQDAIREARGRQVAVEEDAAVEARVDPVLGQPLRVVGGGHLRQRPHRVQPMGQLGVVRAEHPLGFGPAPGQKLPVLEGERPVDQNMGVVRQVVAGQHVLELIEVPAMVKDVVGNPALIEVLVSAADILGAAMKMEV